MPVEFAEQLERELAQANARAEEAIAVARKLADHHVASLQYAEALNRLFEMEESK